MDFTKLLQQVDCSFSFGNTKPYTSAVSSDKARFHVWDGMDDRSVLLDDEQALIAFITQKHMEIVKNLLKER